MPRARKKLIFIVDADKRLAKIYAGRFEEIGWKAIVTHKQEDAMKKITKTIPDVILVDPVDGVDFLRGLRADPRTTGVIQVVVTGRADRASITAAREAGAQAYLIKRHVSPSGVVAKVKKLIV